MQSVRAPLRQWLPKLRGGDAVDAYLLRFLLLRLNTPGRDALPDMDGEYVRREGVSRWGLEMGSLRMVLTKAWAVATL